ncbi:acyltransferase [Latilactobacillus curvatus]|uniref:Acyltransferase n=1 Tax=Latilactobacillus curvatus TaxID=28038 RepID=A0A385AC76_LATCU|nr:acyltransferase [Latilactobacillus curvatus]AXN35272.1 acyltransferase [Latilactobacillus curvatus]
MEKIRDSRYDLLRVIAMGFVLLIHSIDSVQIGQSLTNQIIKGVVTTIILLCNPIFFMVSGHFSLHFKANKIEDYRKYYIKKGVNILMPLFIYQFIYYVVTVILENRYTNIASFLHLFMLDILQNYTTSYFWFMYVLLAFLIAAPFLSKMLDQFTDQEEKIFVMILITMQIIGWGLKLRGINWGVASYPFSGWLIYFLLGRLLESDKKKLNGFTRTVIITSVVIFNVFSLIHFSQSASWGLFDLSPLYILLTVVIYRWFLSNHFCLKISKLKLITKLSKYSFSIYLIHGAILLIIVPHLKVISSSIEAVVIIFICTYMLSFLAAWIIDNVIVKYVKRVFVKNFLTIV